MARPVITSRNRNEWHHVAEFLAGFPVRRMLGGDDGEQAGQAQRRTACAAINFGGSVGPSPAVPDGNHGDNFAKGVL